MFRFNLTGDPWCIQRLSQDCDYNPDQKNYHDVEDLLLQWYMNNVNQLNETLDQIATYPHGYKVDDIEFNNDFAKITLYWEK